MEPPPPVLKEATPIVHADEIDPVLTSNTLTSPTPPITEEPETAPQDIITPVVGGRLGSLKSLEKKFIIKQQEREKIEITQDQVQVVWEDYAQSIDSPSLKQFLLDAEVILEGERLRTIVGTQMAKGMIQQDSALMPFLRDSLNYPGLGMIIDVDISRAPVREEEVGGPTSPREIFEHLAAKNPLLHELRKRFDLTVE